VTLAAIRDVVIILMGIADIILLGLLALIAFALWRICQLLRREIPPVGGSVTRTVTTVEGTTDFVSTTATLPLIRSVSLVFAVTRFVRVLFGRG
jgi:hypothetical protein